jgi:cytochrome bd-type quinol oxidase subunit 2
VAVGLGLGAVHRRCVPALIFGVAVGNVLQGVPFYLTDDLHPIYDGFHAKFLGLSSLRAACGRGVAGDAADPWRGLAVA